MTYKIPSTVFHEILCSMVVPVYVFITNNEQSCQSSGISPNVIERHDIRYKNINHKEV